MALLPRAPPHTSPPLPMAASARCCLHPPPPKQSPQLTPASREIGWGSRCASTAAACVVFSSATVGGLVVVESPAAAEVSAPTAAAAARWSQRRACPSWKENLLESVVPENLPRTTAAKRRAGAVDAGRVAPPAVVLRHDSSCFSL